MVWLGLGLLGLRWGVVRGIRLLGDHTIPFLGKIGTGPVRNAILETLAFLKPCWSRGWKVPTATGRRLNEVLSGAGAILLMAC